MIYFQELSPTDIKDKDSMTLAGPFQLRIFCDSVKGVGNSK